MEEDVAEEHRHILTFHPRRGRMTDAQRDAVTTLLPRHGLPPGPLDTGTLFGGLPVALEIGFGLGHATVEMALEDPGTGIVAVDVHTPGVARLLAEIERRGLTTVRVELGDAVDLLTDRVAEGSLAAIRVFFPDPWPKARHHKRRIVRPDLVHLMATRLAPGGVLHCATDWEPYAEAMREVLDAEPLLLDPYDGWAPRLERPLTKFERQGVEKGHVVRDLVRTRV
ncbi:tRNA (guanosine(46)-N7)-methyltransferase TrmB [Longivirga aurantiaca]|uniref:tRNA (guanine-N(7)-)-methyltransferase n=1 Tax=Longivirga aurantiaca TaxID=1837743 RepID=A0ABW1T065_9ACTN